MRFTHVKRRMHLQTQTRLVRPPLVSKRKVRRSALVSKRKVRRSALVSKRKVGRWLALIMVTIVLLSLTVLLPVISNTSLLRIREVSLSGNYYCTHGEIYAILDQERGNVLTFSEQEIERRLKQELNYVKQVHISKNVVKRSLEIHITEREPFALLKYRLSDGVRFVLADPEGYVLEYVDPSQASDTVVRIVAGTERLPELGDRVPSDAVRLGLGVLHHVSSGASGLASRLRAIDAKHPHKIILHLDELPEVWLASDSIGVGLRYIDLFLKQGIDATNTGKPNSNYPKGYLDVRFEDAIYRGGGI